MGQRLVITIYQPNKSKECFIKHLATAYYHWDAYTIQALEDLKSCYEWWKKNHDNNHDPVHEAIHILEASGAGITEEAESALENPDAFSKATDRNSGLIDITEKEMNSAIDWAEGEAYFNIETGEITFEVFEYLFEEELEDFTKQEIEQALPITFSKDSSEDITNFSGKNIQAVINYLDKNSTCLFKDSNNNIYSYLYCIY